LDAAVEDYQRALKLDPRCAPAYLNLGLTRLFQGKDEEAERDFDLAREIDPELKPSIDDRVKDAYRLRKAYH
jgi:tetratricopeptide (TPR) repeat protein